MVDVSKMLAVNFLIVICLVLVVNAGIPKILRGRPKGGMLGAPRWNGKNANLPPDMWLKQKLDHFNDADTNYWQQVTLFSYDKITSENSECTFSQFSLSLCFIHT